MKARKIATVAFLPDLGVEVDVRGSYYPGTSDYFDKSFGNWLPGDPPEVQVERVSRVGSTDSFDPSTLTRRDQEQLDDAVAAAALEGD